MAEAGLFIDWGEVVGGREKRALKLFNEAMQYWGSLQQKSRSSALTSGRSCTTRWRSPRLHPAAGHGAADRLASP